jgi:hypothetical protein
VKDGRGADADLCRGDLDRMPGVRGAVVCNQDPTVAHAALLRTRRESNVTPSRAQSPETPHVDSPLLVSIEGREFDGFASRVSALKAFIVVDRRTRKIVAEFGTREEAEAFRDGLISSQANGKSDLSIRSTLGDSTDQEAGAAQRAEKPRRTAHPLRRKQRRRPRRTGR